MKAEGGGWVDGRVLAKVGLELPVDERDTTTKQFSEAFVWNQGQNQWVKPVSGG